MSSIEFIYEVWKTAALLVGTFVILDWVRDKVNRWLAAALAVAMSVVCMVHMGQIG